MVINSRTYEDVIPFVKMCLEMKLRSVNLYFDYSENDMSGNYFKHPEIMRDVLRTLVEMEKLFEGVFVISFRLWVPLLELPAMENLIKSTSIEELKSKYSELWELSEGRNVIEEICGHFLNTKGLYRVSSIAIRKYICMVQVKVEGRAYGF